MDKSHVATCVLPDRPESDALIIELEDATRRGAAMFYVPLETFYDVPTPPVFIPIIVPISVLNYVLATYEVRAQAARATGT